MRKNEIISVIVIVIMIMTVTVILLLVLNATSGVLHRGSASVFHTEGWGCDSLYPHVYYNGKNLVRSIQHLHSICITN